MAVVHSTGQQSDAMHHHIGIGAFAQSTDAAAKRSFFPQPSSTHTGRDKSSPINTLTHITHNLGGSDCKNVRRA
jgi:hypothetical protein